MRLEVIWIEPVRPSFELKAKFMTKRGGGFKQR
jgi:hypothetical protein